MFMTRVPWPTQNSTSANERPDKRYDILLMSREKCDVTAKPRGHIWIKVFLTYTAAMHGVRSLFLEI